jgi:cAMP phosphodiesterase
LKANLEVNRTTEDIEKVLVEKIESMLNEVKENFEKEELLPLLRMKIEVSELGILKTNSIIGKFAGRYLLNNFFNLNI